MTLDLDAIQQRAEKWHIKSGPITQTPEQWAALPCDEDCPGCANEALVARVRELEAAQAHITLTSDDQTAAKRIDQLNATVVSVGEHANYWEERAVKAEARVRELEAELEAKDRWWKYELEHRRKAEAERDALREALAAYRSALRSGEPESAKLRAVGDAALTRGAGE